MAFDYSGLELTAQTLVARFGKSLTLARRARTASGSKPWLTTQGASTAAASQSIVVTGVVLGPEKSERNLQTVESRTGRVLVSTETTLPEALSTDWTVDDGTREYAVTDVEIIEPGPTRLLYKLEIAL